MLVVVDFSDAASNYVVRTLDELQEEVPLKRYSLPEPFLPSTLKITRDGQVLSEGIDQDYVIINTNTFEINNTLRLKTLLQVSYMKGR